MKTSEKIALGAGGAVLAVAAAFIIPAVGTAAPEPTAQPQVSVYEINGFAEAPEKVAPVVTEEVPAPVEGAPAEPEPVVEEPAAPDLCPPGTQAQSSDGYNDLSCAPDVCLTLRGLPDPAYPECDYFYPPYYYR